METSRRSANGINIYGYKNPALHGFFISLFLRAGSMYESERDNGITHFFEHISIRNINKIMNGELYSELDRSGLEFNASTYSEMVQFYLFGSSKNFSHGADIITEILAPITLSRAECDTERRRIKAEIRESDERGSLATFTSERVFSGTTLSGTIIGSAGSVDKITATRLEEYRRRTFIKENIFFYITGSYTDSDVEYLLKCIERYEVGCARAKDEIHTNIAPVPQNFCKRDGRVAVKSAEYTMARFTFDIDMQRVSSSALDLIYDLLLSGYASPFFIEMSEERGLFYDISGATERYRNIGILHFSYEVKEKNLYDAVALTVKILRDFKEKLLSPDECMKAGYVDNAYILYDDAREFNFTFAYDNHVMCLGYADLEERIAAYSAVTAEEIRAVAREIFNPECLTLTLKGNKKKIDTARLEEIIKDL